MARAQPLTSRTARSSSKEVANVSVRALPRSTPIWLAAAYMWFFIIRPWEKLFPWMQAVPIERIVAVALLASVMFSVRTRYRLGIQSWAVMTFLAVLFLSALTGYSFNRSWTEVYKYFTMAVFYFVIIWIVRRPNELFFLVMAYLSAVGAFLAKCQWEYLVYGGGPIHDGSSPTNGR